MEREFKISIIIPVYNTSEYLEKCLNSIYNQTLDLIEIILIDDGSTDRSLEILKKYKKEYPNKTQLYSQKNRGQSAARNKGLKKCKGEYIAFVDSDDFIERNMYEEMYNSAKKNNADIVQCLYKNWYPDNEKKDSNYSFINKNLFGISGKDYFQLDPAVGPCDKIYSKTFLEKINFRFEEGRIAEDALIMPQVFYYAEKVNYINKIFYYYRRRDNSTTTKSDLNHQLKLLDDKLYLIKTLQNFKIQKKWNGNIERIILGNIVSLIIKRSFLIKKYRNELIRKFKINNINFIFKNNFSIKTLLKLIKVFIHKF